MLYRAHIIDHVLKRHGTQVKIIGLRLLITGGQLQVVNRKNFDESSIIIKIYRDFSRLNE